MKPAVKQRTAQNAFLILAISVCVLASGCASIAEIDRASVAHFSTGATGTKPMTLPRFLGLDVVARRTVLVGRLVREKAATIVPALEPKPLALPLSHPSNAESPSPAVANAHKVKKAKAAKAAKVKAVAALAQEDCTADPLVEEGILAALDDPHAEVRIKAVEAILRSRRGCDTCCNGGCCSIPIRQKLTTMVYEKTGPCCWLEPNSKARRLARLALDNCGGPLPAVLPAIEETPVEFPPADIISEVSLGTET